MTYSQKKSMRSTPLDCFNPFRDYRKDAFSKSCLINDTVLPNKKEEYAKRKREKIRKMRDKQDYSI